MNRIIWLNQIERDCIDALNQIQSQLNRIFGKDRKQ